MAVSTDGRAGALQMALLANAGFPVLADPGGATARSYGVFDLLGDGVAAPATFIITGDGGIAWRQVGKDIADRVAAETILARLNEL